MRNFTRRKKLSKEAKVFLCIVFFEFTIWCAALGYDQYNKTQFNNDLKAELQLIKELLEEQNKARINSPK